MRIAWTGHRPELFARPDEARALVERETERLVAEHGQRVLVLSGGQRGVDLWAASSAIHHRLPVNLLLPAPPTSFAVDWPAEDAAALAAAIESAAEVTIFGESPSDASGFDARNCALAATCDLLIAVWTARQQGGTFFTVSEARARGKPIREHLLEASAYKPATGERGI